MALKIKKSDTLEYYNAIAYQYYLNYDKNPEWRRAFCKTTIFYEGKGKLFQHQQKSTNGVIKCFMCNKPILRGEPTQIFYLTGIPSPKHLFDPETAKIVHRSCAKSSRMRF